MKGKEKTHKKNPFSNTTTLNVFPDMTAEPEQEVMASSSSKNDYMS